TRPHDPTTHPRRTRMSQDPTDNGALVPAADVLGDATPKGLGLTVADTGAIGEGGKPLQDISPANLHVFGREAAGKTAAFSSQMLDQVRNSDLDEAGDKLGEVVRIARSLDLDSFAGRSKVPVIGGLIDRLRSSKDELVQKFSSTNQQIEQLMRDVAQKQGNQAQRVGEFDRMHDIVREERHALGLHVAAGKVRLAELAAEQRALDGLDDPASRDRRAAVENAMRLLDKRVGDLAGM